MVSYMKCSLSGEDIQNGDLVIVPTKHNAPGDGVPIKVIAIQEALKIEATVDGNAQELRILTRRLDTLSQKVTELEARLIQAGG
jgi:hypothetical protein